MKRPLPDSQNSVKRRKVTTPDELEKPIPVKKVVNLRGKGRLRLKIKEQSICIRQKNQKLLQLEQDLKRLQTERQNTNHILGYLDKFWIQLNDDLELLLTDINETGDVNQVRSILALVTLEAETPGKVDGNNDGWNSTLSTEAEQRVKKTKELVSKLVFFLRKIDKSQTRLWDLLSTSKTHSIDEALRKEQSQLREQLARIRTEISKKHAECGTLRTQLKAEEEKKVSMEQHVRWLEEQNDLIATAYKRLIRTNVYQAKKPQLKLNNSENSEETPEELQDERSRLQNLWTQAQEKLLKEAEDKTRLQNEKIELYSRMEAREKQYQGKDLEIRVLKSDKELQEDALFQAKASHESTRAILASSHKQQVDELERRIEEYAKEISELKAARAKLQRDLEKVNMKELKGLIHMLELRDAEQTNTLTKLREENEQMREQIGNKDLRVRLKDLQAEISLKDSEIKNLKALINTPDVFEKSMYKTQINRLKHRARCLEGEISELKQSTQAKKLHNLEKKMHILGSEVDRSAKDYQDLQKEKELKVQEHLKHIKALTETNSRLKKSNASHNHQVKRLNEEKLALQQTIESQKVVSSKQKLYIDSLKEQIQSLGSRNEALRNTTNASQHAAQTLRNHLISLTQKYYHIQVEMEHESQVNDKLKTEMEKKQSLCTQLRSQNKEFQDKYQRTKDSWKQAKAMMKNGSGDEVLRKQVEIARKRLFCPLCNLRRKEAIITKCLHMFCSKCVHDHFNSRNRKCPSCKCSFGKGDIKDVSFNFN